MERKSFSVIEAGQRFQNVGEMISSAIKGRMTSSKIGWRLDIKQATQCSTKAYEEG